MMRNITAAFLLVVSLLLVSCAPTRWEYQLQRAKDIAWPPAPAQPKVVYVGEVDRFVPNGMSLGSLLLGKSATGDLLQPVSIAVGLDGRIAIADTGKIGVHLYVPSSHRYTFIYKEERKLQSPVSVAFDDNLRLFIVDSALQTVSIFNEQGEYSGSLEIKGRAGFGEKVHGFQRPTAVCFVNGQLYVVDSKQHMVHVFDGKDQYLKSFGTNGTGDGQFNVPTHIAADRKGVLYVNDAMNFRVEVFEGDGTFLQKFGTHGDGSGDFAMTKGIAVDTQETVYVVDRLFDSIQLFDQRKRFALTIGGRGTGPGEFWLPSGIFIDHTGRLYVCDTYNHRIQIFQILQYDPDKG